MAVHVVVEVAVVGNRHVGASCVYANPVLQHHLENKRRASTQNHIMQFYKLFWFAVGSCFVFFETLVIGIMSCTFGRRPSVLKIKKNMRFCSSLEPTGEPGAAILWDWTLALLDDLSEGPWQGPSSGQMPGTMQYPDI